MKTRLQVVAVMLLIPLGGCVFAGLKTNPPEDSLWHSQLSDAGARRSCFSAYLYQPHAERRGYIKQSLDEVCKIFGDEAFRDKVRAEKQWIARAERCRDTPEDRKRVTITGDEIVSAVLDGDFQGIHYFDNSNPRANATTDVCPSRTSIDPGRIDQWTHDVDSKADYLNTLSHELTHTRVTDPECQCSKQKPCLIQFTDDDHTECTERYLVSYHLGDMVECFYRAQHSGEDFDSCIQSIRGKRDEQCWKEVRDIIQSCEPR